jgi:hypothetical protein
VGGLATKGTDKTEGILMVKKRSTTKRELIDTGTHTRYLKRTARGRFRESDDVSRSLVADRRRSAKTTVKSGYGDQATVGA